MAEYVYAYDLYSENFDGLCPAARKEIGYSWSPCRKKFGHRGQHHDAYGYYSRKIDPKDMKKLAKRLLKHTLNELDRLNALEGRLTEIILEES